MSALKACIDVTWLPVDHRGMGRYLVSVLGHLLNRTDIEWLFMSRDAGSGGAVRDRLGRDIPRLVRWGAPEASRVDVCWFPWNRVDTTPRTRRLVMIHDTAMVDWPVTGRLFAFLDNRRMRGMLQRAVARADLIMSPSIFTRGRLMHHFGVSEDRVQVVSEGHRGLPSSNTPRPDRLGGVEGPFVLHVGGLDPRKNALGLLTAWAQGGFEGHRLVMAGLDAQPGHADSVTWLGSVDDAELAWLYGHCELCVVPSFYEGFGLPLLEAMAAGAPVASSGAASLPEVGGDVPEYFDPADASDMVRAIRAVLGAPERARAMRQAGLERAKAFTWERAAEQVVACLRRAAGTGVRETPVEG